VEAAWTLDADVDDRADITAAAVAALLQERHTNVGFLAHAVETRARPDCRRCWCGAVDIVRGVVGLAAESVPHMRRSALPDWGDIVGLNRSHWQKEHIEFFVRSRLVSVEEVARPKYSRAAPLHSRCPRQASEVVEEVYLCSAFR
jgi:hypothetical protein